MKQHPTIAIYSGEIPSTTFIERLIKGLSNSGSRVLLFGLIKQKTSYGKQVRVYGNKNTKVSKLWVLLRYGCLLTLFKRKQKKRLDAILKEANTNTFYTKVKCYPVLWHQPVIFHVQWAKGLDEWLWVQAFGIKLVLSLRGAHINYSPIADTKLAAMYKENFPKVDGFHAVSKAIGLEAQKYGADPQRIHTVYSGLDLNDWTVRDGSHKDKLFRMISIGRPHWIKGYTYALDACKLLQKAGYEFEYTIVGGAKDIELLYQVADLALQQEVRLLGALPFEQVKKHIQQSDLLLLPSMEEGIANVVLEAMALGTLVLSTDCGGMDEVIQDGDNGFLIPLRDSEGMARKIQDIASLTEEKKQQIRETALQTIKEKHSEAQMVEGMMALYEGLL